MNDAAREMSRTYTGSLVASRELSVLPIRPMLNSGTLDEGHAAHDGHP
ncbi:MAG: hypothetical protein RJA70_2968 [Pseudomonadota bacterium]